MASEDRSFLHTGLFYHEFSRHVPDGGLDGLQCGLGSIGPGDLSDGGQVVLELCSKELQQRQQLGCRYLLLFFIRAFLMAHYLRLHSAFQRTRNSRSYS